MSEIRKIVIITGANKGLGKSFADIFLHDKTTHVVSVSRRIAEDQKGLSEDRFCFVPVDLSEAIDFELFTTIIQKASLVDEIIFINNAAIIDPIGKIGNFNDKDLAQSVHVNVLSQVLLINFILKSFDGKKIHLLNISSGAAKSAINGWAMYCAAKSYMKMFCEVLSQQEKERIIVHNVDPGIMDTDMQQTIREVNEDGFPEQNKFINYKKEGNLKMPQDVAVEILNVTNLLP